MASNACQLLVPRRTKFVFEVSHVSGQVVLPHLGCAFLSLEQPRRESLNDTKTRVFYETCAI